MTDDQSLAGSEQVDAAGDRTDEPSDREHRTRVRLARFIGFSVGVTALLLWTRWTGDPITGSLASVPIGYLAYRLELLVFQRADVRILEFLGEE